MSLTAELKNRIPDLPPFRRCEVLPGTKSGGEHYRLYAFFGRSYSLKILTGLSDEQIERDLKENRIWLENDLPVQRIVKAGKTYDGESYTLSQWITGKTLDEVFPCDSYEEEHELGIRCGELLRKIHVYLPKRSDLRIREELNRRLDAVIERLRQGSSDTEAGMLLDAALRLKEEVSEIEDGPCLSLHGDFHTGNLLLDRKGHLHILDPVYGKAGSAEEDLARVLVSAEHSTVFAKGQIDGYYCSSIPDTFWGHLRFYTVLHLAEAWSFGEGKGSSEIYRDLFGIVQKQYPQLLSKDDMIIKNEPPLFWRE